MNQSCGSSGAPITSVGIVPAVLVDESSSAHHQIHVWTDDGETGLIDATSARTQALERFVRSIAPASLPHPVRVGIDGRTATGKTTLANDLVPLVARLGRPVIRVGIDGFHHPLAVRRGQTDLPPWQQYYLDSYDVVALRRELLQPLGPRGNRRYRRAIFDSLHDTVLDEPPLLAPPGAVVLVDGVFLFRPELDDGWDVRISIDVDARDSLQLGPERDRAWVGSAEAA